MDAPALPELSRRPGVEALTIPLADGNKWGLALPSTRLRAEVVEDVDVLGRPSMTPRLVSCLGYPLEIRRLIDGLRAACDQGGPEARYDALIRLATALIRRAHEVDPIIVVSLLELGVDELPGLVEAVLSVVSGACQAIPGASSEGKIDG